MKRVYFPICCWEYQCRQKAVEVVDDDEKEEEIIHEEISSEEGPDSVFIEDD